MCGGLLQTQDCFSRLLVFADRQRSIGLEVSIVAQNFTVKVFDYKSNQKRGENKCLLAESFQRPRPLPDFNSLIKKKKKH